MVWQNVMIPAWDAIKNAISSVWNFIRPILDNIGKESTRLVRSRPRSGTPCVTPSTAWWTYSRPLIHAVGKLLASIPDKVLGISIPGAPRSSHKRRSSTSAPAAWSTTAWPTYP